MASPLASSASGLIAAAHALLGFGGVGQMRTVARLLHLVDHPVPVTRRFERDLAVRRQGLQECDVLLPVVLDFDGRRSLALAVDLNEYRELLVGVTSDHCWHGRGSYGRKWRFHRFTHPE